MALLPNIIRTSPIPASRARLLLASIVAKPPSRDRRLSNSNVYNSSQQYPGNASRTGRPFAKTTQRESSMGEGMKLVMPFHRATRKAHTSYTSGIFQQGRRSFSTSFSRFRDAKDKTHTAESYFKDVDRAPPPSEKTYQVDSANPTVQRPNEAMSGEYSRAGPKTKEYATVEGGTYDVPPSTGPEKDQKSRYGNTQRYYDEHGSGSEVSKPGEGPEGTSAGGRKPEGRS